MDKTIILELGEIGTDKSIYCTVQRTKDGYWLDNDDGYFREYPSDRYVYMTEDGVLKGRYVLLENRDIWDDGIYNVKIYEKSGTVPNPDTDYLWADRNGRCYNDQMYIFFVNTIPDQWLGRKECAECGFEFYSRQLRERWDGAMVCDKCYEEEHPADVWRRNRGR